MTKPNFKELKQQLDDILQWFDVGYDDIDEALAKYKQAELLIHQMQQYLKSAENEIKHIKSK